MLVLFVRIWLILLFKWVKLVDKIEGVIKYFCKVFNMSDLIIICYVKGVFNVI